MEIFGHVGARLGRRSSRLLIASVGLLVAGVVVGTHIASADPPDTRARLTTMASAREVLGREIPQVHFAGPGLQLTSVAVDSISSPNRGVHQTYALANENVVTLSTYRADSIDRVGAGNVETIDLNGAPAVVSVKRIDDWEALTYTWSRGGLANVLHVKLTMSLNRTVADQIAESVN